MSSKEVEWARAQQKRWLKHDVARWLRPDAYRWQIGQRITDRGSDLDLKYNPDQPRVPAGNLDGGQWTEGNVSSVPTDVSSSAKAKGHHYVPRQVFESLPFRDDTRKVFEDATTGKTFDTRSNKNDREHRAYNEAVSDQFKKFVSRTGLRPENMTPEHAQTFLREVQNSKDSMIRNFNMKILLR